MKSTSTLSKLLDKVQTFDALRYSRNFRFLWTSNLISGIGMGMQMLVMMWLAYELTNSAFLVALFAAVRMAPQLLGPFAGVIADRMNRKKLLIAVRSIQLVSAATLAILISTDLLEFWHLATIGFLQGVSWTAEWTTGSAIVMDIVGKESITNAIALNGIAMNATQVVGPAAGGALLAFFGAANCFWVAVGVGAFGIGVLLKLENPALRIGVSQGPVLRNLADGFNYIIHNRDMLPVLAVTFAANIFLWPAFQSFMPVFAKDNLGLGAQGLGYLMTALGVGSFVGVLIIASLGDFRWKGAMYLWGTLLYAVFFGLFAISRLFPLALFLISMAGLASSSFMILQSTLILILAPEDMRGRSMGFMSMAIGVLPFGCLAIGAVANVIGASLATGIGCIITVVMLIALVVRMPNLLRLR